MEVLSIAGSSSLLTKLISLSGSNLAAAERMSMGRKFVRTAPAAGLFAVLLVQLLLWNCRPALSQSTDKNSPTPLHNNQIQGETDLNGRSYFYSLVAGPGDLNISIEGATNYYSGDIHVIVRDEEQREMSNIALNVSDTGARKSTIVHLNTSKPLTLQILLSLNVGVKVKYAIHLDGPLSANSASSGAQSLSSSNPLVSPTLSKTEGSQPVERFDAENSTVEDKWALIVGVSKFQKPGINLKYSAKDAGDLANYLIHEAHFAPDHVKLLLDEQATKERVLAELGDKWLPRLAHPNDLVLIFISSHGSPSQMDLEGLNYLVMYNTDPDSLYATGLPLQELATAIKQRVHSNRVVLIIDACHSGGANTAKGLTRVGNVDSTLLLQGTGQLVICSSQPNQVSWESKRYQNGVFTRQLIEALRKQSDKGKLDDVFESMKNSVQSEVLQDRSELQTPVLKSTWRGDRLNISAPPVKPRGVPEELK